MLTTLYDKFSGSLVSNISASSPLLPIDTATLALISSNVDFSNGNWAYLLLSCPAYSEEVRVTGISGANLIIDRATSGSTAQTFTVADTIITSSFLSAAVSDVIAATPNPLNVTFQGQGLANVNQTGSVVTVNVPTPEFTGADGIAVLGSWPNIQVAAEGDDCGCCSGEGGGGAGGGGGITSLNISSSILQGSMVGSVLKLTLNTPTFTGDPNISVTGTWPNYTFAYTGAAASGTVTGITVADGLYVTGNPNLTPTLGINNTGVVAGTYGGLSVNTRGQITSVAGSFNPVSSIISTSLDVTRTGDAVTIEVDSATTANAGITLLADSATTFDATNDTTVATPKVVAKGVAKLMRLTGTGTSTAESDATYTSPVGSTATTINIAAGKKAIIFVSCTVLDGTTPNTPIAYGISVFNSTTKVWGNKTMAQSQQFGMFTLDGPIATGVLTLATTALPAGSSVISSSLHAVVFDA